jgi:hypothetical protein
LGAGALLFLAVIAYLVASSLTRRTAPTFAATTEERGALARGAVDTLTVDASDPERWRYLDLDRGAVTSAADSGRWHLAVRRFHVVAAGQAANLGSMPFERVTGAPDSGYVATTFGADTTNAAMARWYRYGMLTHLLESRGDVYVVKGTDERALKLEILSYYCPGMKPGCMTVRYAWLEEDVE